LGGNALDDAAALAPTLQQLTGLLILKLNMSQFVSSDMAALVPALQQLTDLRHLCVGINACSLAGHPKL
jgi:hypothetical protein